HSSCSLRSKLTKEIRRRNSAIHQKIASRDKRTFWTHEKGCDIGNFVSRARSPHGVKLNHAPVPFSARTGQLIFREWCDNNPRTNRVDSRASLPPSDSFCHNP